MMKIYALSDKGKFRRENQDTFELCETEEGILAVVCDGMGGAAAGSTASHLAATRFLSAARMGLEAGDGSSPEEILRTAADAANRRVFEAACDDPIYAGMGTTLVAGYIQKNQAYFVNVGDSRAYCASCNGMTQITADHSLVNELVRRGELTQEEARRDHRRNIITRAVGTEPFVTSDTFSVAVNPGDRFVLCSDGITNAMTTPELHQLILAASSPRAACESVIARALETARDNITVTVIFADKEVI